MPSTSWCQTDEQLTLRLSLPADATHECVRLLLKRQRLTLLYAPDAEPARVLLRRRLAGAIDPQRTPGYAIHDGQLTVALHKAHPGGWDHLFATAGPSRAAGLQTGHLRSASYAVDVAATRVVAGRATERCCGARAGTRHAWRSPVRCRTAALDALTTATTTTAATATVAGAASAPAAKGDDAEEEEGSEGEDAVDYPLPGSRAGCDACGREVRRYHHCLRCGEDEGFDLCTRCYRAGAAAHLERHGPAHALQLVTPHSAPLVPLQLRAARDLKRREIGRRRAEAAATEEKASAVRRGGSSSGGGGGGSGGNGVSGGAQLATREGGSGRDSGAPPEPLVALVPYSWTQHHAEVEVRYIYACRGRGEIHICMPRSR